MQEILLSVMDSAAMNVLWSAVMFIVVLSVLVFVHEWGHFFAARSVGVSVETFSIGFGKELFGWNDKNGCRWKVSAVPLGGYVKMKGEMMHGNDASADADSFTGKGPWARMWVVIAGPLMNFVFAMILLTGLMMAGEQKLLPQVGSLMPNMPAQEAGLQENDLILAINGQEIPGWQELVETVSVRGGETLTFRILRAEQELDVMITPKLHENKNIFGEDVRVGMIGIRPAQARYVVHHPLPQAAVLGVVRTWEMTENIGKSVWKMIQQTIPADQVGGPIAIAEMAGSSASAGIYAFLMFMALISINLGLINLFPIPVLDGGQMVYCLAEILKGSPLSERVQSFGQYVGLAMIGCLMVFAFYNDILRMVGYATNSQ